MADCCRITIERGSEGNGGEESVPKYVMLELQGVIETRDGMPHTPELGVLSLERGGALPVMTVGRSRLEGAVVKLHNPLLVIEKDSSSDASSSSSASSLTETHYKVLGVIREKYLFKTRPRA